ncbi:uncharacterized protein KGF55_000338 [Candida pseudojiufengensis]|uniref:uncharacterized protein n=1 Tax=Candida pseudojiufengensis TaxID=497109 RepID=UPI00222528AA|nr:uncharacterized protein KGF55_000338 [Candida pseudojiufengensis]KAI5966929.1 hypothetical protein KGF55_000338 [Candida pseudojiufengensis]
MFRKAITRLRHQQTTHLQYRSATISLNKIPNSEAVKLVTKVLKRTERRVKEYENVTELSKQYEQHKSNLLKIIKSEEISNALFRDDEKFETYLKYTEICQLSNKNSLSFNNTETRNTIMLICAMLVELVSNTLAKQNNSSKIVLKNMNYKSNSDDWLSLENYRKYFNYYKSSQFLNDDKIDPTIKTLKVPKFKSNTFDDTKIIENLDVIFKEYKISDDQLSHLTLALKIVQVFTSTHNHIPTLKTFAYLLDKLGELNLLSFQKIVYLSLFQYKHQPTVLATPNSNFDSKFPQLMADHFLHIITAYPEILKSLLFYQALRKDSVTFIELLSFLKLDKIAGEIMVIKSPLLSKSKYKLPTYIPSFNFDKTLLLTISRRSLYDIMRLSVDMKLFEYLDLLFNKIVLHSKDRSNIQLNYIEDNLVEGKIFDNELFSIMFTAAIESNDPGRVIWLLPFFDEFLKENDYSIPNELKDKTLHALKLFGLEGKLRKYEEHFVNIPK